MFKLWIGLIKKEYAGYRDKIINFLNSVTIFYLSEDDYVESFKLLKKYKFDVNYSECTIVTSMIKHNVDYIVSFDNDFDRIKGLYRICV